MSTTIGIFEAKTHFSTLLDRVEHGESITITRHGRRVAKIEPIKAHDPEKAQQALDRFLARQKPTRPCDMTWKEMRDEGRKW